MAKRPSTLRFKVEVPHPEESRADPTEFLTAIGRVVFSWGQFETLLGTTQLLAVHVADRFGVQEDQQIFFKRKITSIRKIYSKTDALKDQSERMFKYLDSILKLSTQRDILIHSAVSGIRPTKPPRLVLSYSGERTGDYSSKNFEFTVEEINQLTTEIDRAMQELAILHFGLLPLQEDFEISDIGPLLDLVEEHRLAPTEELQRLRAGLAEMSSLRAARRPEK